MTATAILRTLANLDAMLSVAIAKYFQRRAEQAANREADRAVRRLRRRLLAKGGA